MINMYRYTERELEELATNIKNIVVMFLLDRNFLTQEQCTDLQTNYAIITRKPSFFKRIFSKKSEKEKEDLYYIVVCQQTLDSINDEISSEECQT